MEIDNYDNDLNGMPYVDIKLNSSNVNHLLEAISFYNRNVKKVPYLLEVEKDLLQIDANFFDMIHENYDD